MSFSENVHAVMMSWNKEEWKKIHDPEFMFICKTELVTLDDWTDNMEKYALSREHAKSAKERSRTALVHENRHLKEWFWEDNGELVTHVCMTKKGLTWRSIAYRETIEDFETIPNLF